MRRENQFTIENRLDRPMVLNIEPEGAFFPLAHGDEVKVFDSFDSAPVTVRLDHTETGEPVVSIWPGDGDVRIEKGGIDVLELIQRSAKARSA
jgi:hypothetical protein